MTETNNFQVTKRTEVLKSYDDFYILSAKKNDMPLIADFINSSADWYREFVHEKDMSEHEVDENWQKENYEMRDFYLGLTDDHEPVGTISLQYFGDYAYLGYVYLDVEHVGKGYGHKLMNFAKEKVASKDKQGMVLIAHPEAEWATKAYKKFGFKKICSRKEEVLKWNGGVLENHYEEGFELYLYEIAS